MKLFEWIASLFNKLIKVFKAFIAEALPIAKQIIIAQLKDIALETVQNLAVTDLSNDDKRKEAIKAITEYAKLNGIKAGESIINTMIELAVQKLKGE